jgi:hypothetical protein
MLVRRPGQDHTEASDSSSSSEPPPGTCQVPIAWEELPKWACRLVRVHVGLDRRAWLLSQEQGSTGKACALGSPSHVRGLHWSCSSVPGRPLANRCARWVSVWRRLARSLAESLSADARSNVDPGIRPIQQYSLVFLSRAAVRDQPIRQRCLY